MYNSTALKRPKGEAKEARHTARLYPPKYRGGFCGVAVSFSCHAFCTCALVAHCCCAQASHTKANNSKEPQPGAQTKTHPACGRDRLPGKNCRKLSNIKWPYRFASHFFPYAYAGMPTHKKSPISTLC